MTEQERLAVLEARLGRAARRCRRRLRDWGALWRTLGLSHPQTLRAEERRQEAFRALEQAAAHYAAARAAAGQEQEPEP